MMGVSRRMPRTGIWRATSSSDLQALCFCFGVFLARRWWRSLQRSERSVSVIVAISAYACPHFVPSPRGSPGGWPLASGRRVTFALSLQTGPAPSHLTLIPHSELALTTEYRQDAQIAGQATGAMSFAFIAALKKNPQQSYVQLLNSIRDELEGKYSQKPQLSCSHPLDTNILYVM